jgi:hypothetical protein
MPAIPNATKYTIDNDGRLYRDGKRLKTQRSDNGVYVRVMCDDGIRRRFDVSRLGGPKKLLTQDHILGQLNAKIHPDYPDYAVTAYGDVYCIRQSKAGLHANNCYFVPDFLHGPAKKRYISIRRPNGARYQIRLARFVQQTWGSKSKFNEEE